MKDYSAPTIEKAIQAAEKDLSKSRDQLKITVVQQPRHGFLGIGRRPAKIQVAVKVKKGRDTSAKKNQPHQQPTKTQAVGNMRHHKHSTHARQNSKQEKHRPKKKQIEHKKQQLNEHDSQISQEEMERRHQANLAKTKTVAKQMAKYLHDILAAMGVENKVEITEVKAHKVVANIKAEKSGRVIGRHGRRINALEELASAYMDYHGTDNVEVTVDTANYRKRRRETLKRVAENAVVDVISTGQAVFLDPMPARERKQLHRELEHNKHVVTYSNGKEPHRSVVIAPKN